MICRNFTLQTERRFPSSRRLQIDAWKGLVLLIDPLCDINLFIFLIKSAVWMLYISSKQILNMWKKLLTFVFSAVPKLKIHEEVQRQKILSKILWYFISFDFKRCKNNILNYLEPKMLQLNLRPLDGSTQSHVQQLCTKNIEISWLFLTCIWHVYKSETWCQVSPGTNAYWGCKSIDSVKYCFIWRYLYTFKMQPRWYLICRG